MPTGINSTPNDGATGDLGGIP
jgi:hypothetical protein